MDLLDDLTVNVFPFLQKDASAVELAAERREHELLRTEVIIPVFGIEFFFS